MAEIIVEISDAKFTCQTPEDAVEVARRWKAGERTAARRTQADAPGRIPSATDATAERYRAVVLKWLQAVRDKRPNPVPSAEIATKIAKKGQVVSMGTVGVKARQLLEKPGIEFTRVLVSCRERIEGKEVKCWKSGPDIDRAIEALRSFEENGNA